MPAPLQQRQQRLAHVLLSRGNGNRLLVREHFAGKQNLAKVRANLRKVGRRSFARLSPAAVIAHRSHPAAAKGSMCRRRCRATVSKCRSSFAVKVRRSRLRKR